MTSKAWLAWQEMRRSVNKLTQRQAVQFARQFHKATEILGAFRGVCKFEGCDQYEADMQLIANSALSKSEVCNLLSDFDFDQQVAWFNHAADNLDLIVTYDGYFMPAGDAYRCERCEDTYSSDDDFQRVVLRLNGLRIAEEEDWCGSCCDSNAFSCYVSNSTYDDSSFSSCEAEGETACQAYLEANGHWMYSERVEQWIHEDNWVEEEHGDGGEEEEEEEFTPPIPQYHNAARRWSLDLARNSLRDFFGFELEVLFPTMFARHSFWMNNLRSNFDFCGEVDGSLDRNLGLEIITRPFNMFELERPNVWKDLVQRLRDDPVETPETCSNESINYGLHITANWNRLTTDHTKRAVRAVYELKPTVKCLSKRYSSYAKFDRFTFGTERKNALRRREDNSIELRTMNATTEWERIMAGAEFMAAIACWTLNPNNVIVAPFVGPEFRRWIKTCGDYPNLSKVFSVPQHQEATVACA